MCDPLVGGLIAGAASLASGAMAADEQSQMQDATNQATNDWVAYQNKVRAETQANEAALHDKAEAAREATLAKVTPQAQTQIQGNEQERLNTLYNDPKGTGISSADPNYAQSQLLSGEKSGTKDMSGITSQINQATAAARGRIAALATVGSYGGSFGGLGTVVPMTFAQGGDQLNLYNDERRGNLSTGAIRAQVEPVHYAMGAGAGQAGGIAKALGGLAGSAFGATGFGGSGTSGNVSVPGGGAYSSDALAGGGWGAAPNAWA